MQFRMPIVKKRRVARDWDGGWVMIVLPAAMRRTRLTGVVVRNEPLCQSEMKRSSLSVRSLAGQVNAGLFNRS